MSAAAPKTCLVTGASGFVGKHLLTYLSSRHPEWHIVGMTRTAPIDRLKAEFPSVEWIKADLASPESYREKTVVCDYVFHLGNEASVAGGDGPPTVIARPT